MFAITACAQPSRPHDAGEIAAEQRDAGALDRDVGAGAHGDADIGRGEGRGVVDAVARHRDHAALAAQPLDHGALLIGQHLGLDLGDAELARDRLGGGAVVAGEHDDADVFIGERSQRCGCGPLDRIGDGDDAGCFAVDRDEDHGRAVTAQFLGLAVQAARS